MYNLAQVKKKIENGGLIIGANTLMGDSVSSELMGFAGCDYVWIDAEHAPLTDKDIEEHVIAAHSAGAAAFVRIPWNDPILVKRIMDMGPDGIIFPFIKTAEDARLAVASCTYPQNGGIRGWNPLRAAKYGCTDTQWYIENVDSLVWKILMIEHIDAVNNIEEILKVKGVDAIMIGPSDLSSSLNKLMKTDDPEVFENIKKAAEAARRAGVVIGIAGVPIYTPDAPESLQTWFDMGVRMISVGQDEYLLCDIVRKGLEVVKTAYEARR